MSSAPVSPALRGGFVFLFFFLPLLFCSCKEKAPLILSIEPPMGMIGEILTIRGENFGSPGDESYITIGGIPPTGSSYIEWRDDYISLKVPEFGEAGLVYVHRGGEKSNPMLFSNRATLPLPMERDEVGIGPRIFSVNPPSGPIGSLITIKGSGFGSSREESGVFFAWNAESSLAAPAETRDAESIEVFDAEFGYDLWSEREIRVRVPDGAVSGNLEVRTTRGNSQAVFFEITGKSGTKTFKDKWTYTLSYSVDIQTAGTSLPNTLYLWVPHPVTSSSQRNTQLLSRSREPFVDNYRGTTLFQLTDLAPMSRERISQSYLVTVYAIETSIKSPRVRSDTASPIAAVHTQPSNLIPSDDPRVAEQTKILIGREADPYEKARKIYQWLIRDGRIQWGFLSGGITDALEQGQMDPYTASLLFCAMARAAGIPAIPVSGVLVNRSLTASRHYWAEFWLEGFGWVPLDPALGAGAAPPSFILREDRASYYFGNLDNQRIAFSRGQTVLSQMDPRGRLAAHNRDYALQNLWEEAVGGLESYSSLWSDVTISGMYAQ
ncbi:MAG: IPT/TIG domain-containing protein [Treponema sp.]|jgi:transglutaminase-like putative cysteine protease|nr:IPT/TIG domain-containing protein [Treponema sp.]